MSGAPGTPPSLPVQLSRFVGREREITEVRRLLGERRLVTLTGAGGSGKTRLAVEAAGRADLETVWVDLTPLPEGGLVAEHLAASLGARLEGSESAEAVLVRALRHRPLLLVLDNCEHVLDGVTPLLASLLRRCPELRVLATSREALGVQGEVAWLLPTLTLPPVDAGAAGALGASEAVELFVVRARDAAPSFVLDDTNVSAVTEICRRLDGLPLAIELAAARVKVLAPEQIAGRLGDRFRLLTSGSRTAPSRHRTLEEVITWSYRLLTGPEREVLKRLSVFVGDFSLEAAEEVAVGGEVAARDVLDLVDALVGKSLVVAEAGPREMRYRLLETVHQFARARLEEEGGGDEVRRRHADFFLAGAVAREDGVFNGGSDPAHLAWFEAELGELRAAAEWLEGDPDGPDAGLRLATTLVWVWFVRGRSPEGRRWLERALRHPGGGSPLPRGRALAALALLAFAQGDVEVQRECAGEAAGLLRGRDAPGSLVLALALLGQAGSMEGRHEEARSLLEEAVAAAREAGCPELIPALAFRGSGAAIAGEYPVALACWDEACDLARERGLSYSEPHLTDGLGRLAWADGDEATARGCFRRTLEIEVDDPWCLALAVQGGACVALMDGEPERAAELLGAAAGMRRRIVAPPRPEEVAFLEGLARACVARLGQEACEAARERGALLDHAAALDMARGGTPSVSAAAAAATPPAAAARPPAAGTSPAHGGEEGAGPAGRCEGGAAPWLSVSALGPLEIRLRGETLDPGSWSHARPRELLLHLLCFPEGRTREQIGLAFWPDASAAQVKNSFHVLLHKLRRALGGNGTVVVRGDRYRIAPDLEVRFDVDAFEREITAALRQVAPGRSAAAGEPGGEPDPCRGAGSVEGADTGRLERALGLYRGDFMEGEPAGDWHLEVHDRARRLYAEGLSVLADRRMEAEDLEGAAQALERLVLVEDLREDAYRRLMVCLARMGRRDRSLLHYARLVALLEDGLGAAPEPETEALALQLREVGAV